MPRYNTRVPKKRNVEGEMGRSGENAVNEDAQLLNKKALRCMVTEKVLLLRRGRGL
jgi:hypothetical protein